MLCRRRCFSCDWNDWGNFRRLFLVGRFFRDVDGFGWRLRLLDSVDDRCNGCRCMFCDVRRLLAFNILFAGSLETKQHVAVLFHV